MYSVKVFDTMVRGLKQAAVMLVLFGALGAALLLGVVWVLVRVLT